MVNLSIVVPATGTEKQLEDTLVSVLTHRPDSCEVIVVYPGKYDDPYQLRGEVSIVEFAEAPSRVALANAGIRASSGSIINLLDVGVEVTESWSTTALSRFEERPKLASCVPLVLCKEKPKITVSAGLAYRLRGLRKVLGEGRRARGVAVRSCMGPTMAAAFYRSSAIRNIGGFNEFVGDELADIDLALRLSKLGDESIFEPASVLTQGRSSRKTATSFEVGVHEERMFWMHARNVGWIRSLASHGLVLASDMHRYFLGPALIGCWLGRAKGAWDSLSRRAIQPRRVKTESVSPMAVSDAPNPCVSHGNDQSAAA